MWFAWAWGAPAGQWFAPAALSLLFLAAHLRWTTHRAADLRAVLACVFIGALCDTAMLQAQLMAFALPNPEPLHDVQPVWMLWLWACLGCTFHTSLRWLTQWPRLAYPLSGALGWAAYAGAERLGAVTLLNAPWSGVVLALFWAVFVPTVLRWSARSVP